MNQLHASVVQKFDNYFSTQGYARTPELSLACTDPTLPFTNSTIVAWKQHLLDRTIPEPGTYMKQRCLRLQGTMEPLSAEMISETQFRQFLGAFNMLGILTGPQRKEQVQQDIAQLLTEQYDLKEEDIRIQARTGMQFIESLRNKFLVQYDALPDTKYFWSYGMPGIAGTGATIQVRSGNNPYEEIGQLIEIKHDHETVGYEFGFGIETFIARAQGQPRYTAWSVAQAAPAAHQFYEYLHCVSALAFACSVPQEQRSSKTDKETRRLARRVLAVEDFFHITPKATHETLERLCTIEFSDGEMSETAVHTLEETRRKQQVETDNYTQFVRSMKVRRVPFEQASEKATRACKTQYHLDTELGRSILQQVYNER